MALGHSVVSRAFPVLSSAALVAGALTLAVFYHGPQMLLLAGAQALLILWLLVSLLRSFNAGVRLPYTPLTVSLTLFWLWLGISLMWSRVPSTSIINFWWVGSFALVFWIYTIAPERDRIWDLVARFALLGALALSVMALVQLVIFREPPRATFINIHSFAALLMLVVLPACAYLLIALDRFDRARAAFMGVAVFLIFFVIAATNGRGTTISLLIGMAVLLLLTVRRAPLRHLALIVGLLGGAYLSANLLLHGGLAERLLTMTDPADAALPRIMIWRGSWEMVLDNPWFGIGLGTYYLAWPPYRHPADSTMGFFAHNDYLQLWIETGLPGLILLLAVFISVLVMMVRFLRLPPAKTELRTEAVGLFCGLFAVAAHSFLDFNFYILSISIAAGLMLGRFHERVTQVRPYSSLVIKPSRFIQRRAYRTITVLLALFPLLYLAALWASDRFYHQGVALAVSGQLREADGALTRAQALTSADDKLFLAHADLFRHTVARIPKEDRDDRETLYSEALRMLERAEKANPYRALVYTVRGRLYEENPDLAGPDSRALAEQAYARALALNPRMADTRTAYAKLLLDAGQTQAAIQLLEQGMHYWYYPSVSVLAYYHMAASLQRAAGELEKAERIETRIKETKLLWAQLAPARPITREFDVAPPANESRR